MCWGKCAVVGRGCAKQGDFIRRRDYASRAARAGRGAN